MKIGLSLGVVLNLGDYSTGRVRVDFEDEYLQKELTVASRSYDPSDHADRMKIADYLADEIYTLVENKLIQKVETFINRLESEGFIGG